MNQVSTSKLSQHISRLRWQVPLLAFLLVLAHQLLEHTWLMYLPRWQHFGTQLLFYGLIGPLLAWWALTSLWRSAAETEAAQQALRQAHTALEEANQRLEFLIRVSRRLAEAEDEETLMEVILALPLEVVPAVGCSLIRFDERGQPLPVIHRGNLDLADLDAWSAQLAMPEIRHTCQSCSLHQATEKLAACPLFDSTPSILGIAKAYCLPLVRGSRDYGVLNIYLSEADQPDIRAQTLLATMAHEMSLALESLRLRSRELATLYRLQQARRLSNLQAELTEVLTHLVEALEVDGGILFLTETETGEFNFLAEAGRALGAYRSLVQGLARGAQQAKTPLIIGDLKQDGDGDQTLRALLIAPLRNEGQLLGSMILWTTLPNTFTARHGRLVAAVAGQMALLVENHHLYLQVEHQSAMAERARLAREIHDGLAQTLSYLKLRTARVFNWLAAGEIERARAGLAEVRDLLAEVYVDTREAIDGLRLKPGVGDLNDWLDQILSDFQSLSAIQVETGAPLELTLPPEVQAQLLRIVQESLSNIRKHADATYVRLDWQADEQWLTLRIADNGQGFEPDDVPPLSRHGLQIMQERAELLDADFQLISRPGAGAQVVVRLPVSQLQRI